MKLTQFFMIFERLQVPAQVQRISEQDQPIGPMRRGLIAGVSLVAERGILLLVEFDANQHDRQWYGRRSMTTGVWHDAVLLAGTTGWGDLSETRYLIQGIDFACIDVRLF